MFQLMKQRMHSRSGALLLSIEGRLDRILQCWLLLAGLASAARLATSPVGSGQLDMGTIAPYLLLILAPFASTVLALRWFADGESQSQPHTRLAVIGRWRTVDRREAQCHPLYGTSGIMVSLLVGMMLNVPIRAAEYLAAMPPLPHVSPPWLSTLHMAMTFDVVLFTSLYMVAFVAALRRVPLFPRLLVAIWACDLAMQLVIAQWVVGTGGLPAPVATALHGLLEGNVQKVLISVALWLPYLLMSTRVNLTYRSRAPA